MMYEPAPGADVGHQEENEEHSQNYAFAPFLSHLLSLLLQGDGYRQAALIVAFDEMKVSIAPCNRPVVGRSDRIILRNGHAEVPLGSINGQPRPSMAAGSTAPEPPPFQSADDEFSTSCLTAAAARRSFFANAFRVILAAIAGPFYRRLARSSRQPCKAPGPSVACAAISGRPGRSR